MSTDRTEGFATIDRMLGEISFYHQEMSRMVAEYQETFERAQGRATDEVLGFVRVIPGAKYRMIETYIREQWLVLEQQLKALFPVGEAPEERA